MIAARKGTLVGIASVAGVRGLPGSGAYSASKAAALKYLEALRVEMRPQGVDVVTIAPGYIRTPMTARNPYPMPFLMDAGRFAVKVADAIARKTALSRSFRGRCASWRPSCMCCRAGSTTSSSKRRRANRAQPTRR